MRFNLVLLFNFMQTMLSILKEETKHLKYFLIQFLTVLNENIFKNVIILLINFSLYKHNVLQPELLVVFSTLIFLIPQLLFSRIAGKICDKYNKNYLIKRLKTYEIYIYSFVLFSIWTRNIFLLCLSLLIVAVQSVFFEIIKFSIIPELVEKQGYLKFNGITIFYHFFAIVLGAIFSYIILLKYIGMIILSAVLITNVVLNYLISKKLLFDKNEKIENFAKSISSIKINEIINFIKYDIKNLLALMKRKYLFLPALGIAWFWFVIFAFINNLGLFAKNYLNTTEIVAITFLSLFIFGILLGIVLCIKIFKNKINIAFTPISAIVITFLTYRAFEYNILPNINSNLLTFTSFFFNKSNLHLLTIFILIGVFAGIYIVPLYSFLETKTKNINRGRIFSAVNLMNYLFMIFSSLLCYILAKKNFYTIDTYLFIAIANLVIGFYAISLLPRSVFFMFGRWIFKIVFKVKVVGLENYEEVGNKKIIIIANHQSFLDACLISLFVEENLSFAVELNISKKWWMKPVMKLTDCHVLDSGSPMALKSLINLSRSGRRIMIFPEGRITTTGIMMKIYEGPAMIAEKSGAFLLPIRIEGAQYSIFSRLRNKVKRRLFPEITLTVLPAQKMEINKNKTARQKRVEAGNKLHKLMLDLFYSTSKKDETIFQALLRTKKILGGKHKIVEDINFTPINYKTLILKSFVLGNYLSKFTEQKEYLGIMLPSAMATIAVFLGMHTRDRIPVMINFTAGVKNILSACSATNIRFVFTSKKFIEKGKLHHIVDSLTKNNITVIFLENELKKITLKDKLLGLLFSKFPNFAYSRITNHKVNCDDTAVVLFTSGSENAPKGVVLTHKNFNANRNQLLSAFNFSAQDKIFVALPLFHSFGLGATIISLITGSRIFFYPTPLHYRTIPELIYRTNSTIMFATNTFLEKYAKYANPFDFYSLKFIAIGGEKLTENNKLNWADKYGVKLFEGYGATECAPIISFNSAMKYKFGTVGTLAPGMEYKLEAVEGINEGGRLLIRGENVFKGYIFADNPCKIVEPKDGWYDTGDIVKIDKENYITIIGRAKRFAKISGEMVSMTMVESQLSYVWKDSINAVIYEKDEKKGEKLVVITTEKEAKLKDVIDYFKKHELAEISIPKEIRYREEIPLLGNGKINYIELERLIKEESNEK